MTVERRTDVLTVIRKNWRLFGAGIAVSVLLHAGVATWMLIPREVSEEEVVARFEFEDDGTPFFIAAPRLVREFAFRKQAVPEGAPVVRSSGDRTATVVQGVAGFAVTGTMQWTRAGGSADFVVTVGTGDIGEVVVGMPRFDQVVISSMKEPEKRIDMETEFLDLAALDIGKVKSLVIQDPTDKRNISGFVYLGLAWGTLLTPSQPRAVLQLARWINQYTNINAKVDDQLYLDSQDLLKAPFIYITTNTAFELTEHESESLARYLRNGGFVVADNDRPKMAFGPAEASIRQMFKDALGRDARFERIPNNHPLFHVFFDLDGPPPGGEVSTTGAFYTRAGLQTSYWLEGIYLDNRLVAVYSDKGYGPFWVKESENEPQVKMGINLVVFALTQKGSIAQQQIDFYNQ